MLSLIDSTVEASAKAFEEFKNLSRAKRAQLLKTIATELNAISDTLIPITMRESNLPEARLKAELARTIFQLNSYADACIRGEYLKLAIDTADKNRTPPKPDVRKMMIPIGPVVVFGASNFPFAYSTAGGDVASALAAGCTVIVKAHKAHLATSTFVAQAIHRAVENCELPNNVFSHLDLDSNTDAIALVQHPKVKAVGFTGSFAGGKAIFDAANARKQPIPVFAEMSSINPTFLFPDYLTHNGDAVATALAGSITLGCGQFCTNPGLMIGIKGEALDNFKNKLTVLIQQATPSAMLTQDIAVNYRNTRKQALEQVGVTLLSTTTKEADPHQDIPTIASVSANDFLVNDVLQHEVFGSFSLLVECNDFTQMKEVVTKINGQLTATLFATVEETKAQSKIVNHIIELCGRIIHNNVPTGVEVCQAMQHGGPWPASTDARFGSVGANAIDRFVRPLSFQNWPDELLPEELQNSNPQFLIRTVNNKTTTETIL